MIDKRGTELEVGQEVAYNLSGQVVKGRIRYLNEDNRRYHRGIQVEEFDKYDRPTGHVSKISNEFNLLVLHKGES